MMFITRSVVERQACRSLAGVAFAALLVAVGALLVAGSADADASSPPKVYHSPSHDGAETPWPDCPPGCLPVPPDYECVSAGGGGGEPYDAIVNGSFENGEGGEISDWTVDVQKDPELGEGYEGGFYRVAGTEPPISWVWTEHTTVGPSEGGYHAVSDQRGPTSTALSHVFNVPAGATSVVLSFDMFVKDWLSLELSLPSPIVEPGYLEIDSGNQFATVDILTAAAFAGDPFTDDVVQNLYSPGIDPPPHLYQSYVFDLTGALGGGGTFVLRFAQIDVQWYLNQGVDNVSLMVTSDEGPPPPPMNCVIQGGSGEELFVYIDGGNVETVIGTQCRMDEELGGDGEELCGGDVQFDLVGFGAFTNFYPGGDPNLEVPDPGMETLVWHPNCCEPDPESGECTQAPGCNSASENELPSGTTQLRMNFRRGDQAELLPAGPRRLGKLVLDSTPPTGSDVDTKVLVSGVAGVGAKLQVRQIAAGGLAPETIAQSSAVPEPGAVAQIVSGLFGLGVLQWLRRRRGS